MVDDSVSAFLQVLLDKLSSQQQVVDFFEKDTAVLKELRNCLLSANSVLADAEEKQIGDPHVKLWLDDLNQVISETNDIVDEIEYEANRRLLEAFSGKNTSKILKCISTLPASASDKALKAQIQNIIHRSYVMLENQFALGLEQGVENRPLLHRLPAPLAEESHVFGRASDKEAITKLLLSDHAGDRNVGVIPIVGMGGLGKTTLAQLIYDDLRMKNYFETKAWVTVSVEFDVLQISKAIYERFNSRKCDISDLHELQFKLRNLLYGKKFLIVLDDVWNENYHLWDVLQSSFEFGARGSKIIVTTRSSVVALVMGNLPAYYLQPICDDDCWLLFSKHAFRNTFSDAHLDLLALGKQIVKKCKGVPLAVKSLAKLLCLEPNPKNWEYVLKSDVWQLQLPENDILSDLRLSYNYLPTQLKLCFRYCSLFPKDYEFRKDKIILLWMAEDLLRPQKGKRLEDVGEEYLSYLISRSLFQESTSKQRFYMHDLMHDLAMSITNSSHLQLDDHGLSYCEGKTRRLTSTGGIDDTNEFRTLSKPKSFRTFLALSPSADRVLEHLKYDDPFALAALRVLSVSHTSTRKLPDFFDNLKLLRYLDLSFTEVAEVPNSVCNLYNLQTLLLSHCRNLVCLPIHMARLINLRHLDISGSISLVEMPPKMSSLKNLQTLSDFVLGKHSAFNIQELGELQHLHGRLKISGLENVVAVGPVLKANLKDKKYLSGLSLEWYGDTNDSKKERKILDALQPHTNLMELKIDSYTGTRFPMWVGHPSYSSIVKVCLVDCKNCCFLPSLGQLPSLKELEIDGFDELVAVGVEFYHDVYSVANPFRLLELLVFRNMTEWEEWVFIEIAENGGLFPRVKELYLEYCPKLNVCLPDYLPSLTTLKIYECKQLMPLKPRAEQMDIAFPSLRTMILFQCPEQELFLEGGFPSSLNALIISSCHNLKALNGKGFRSLTLLEELKIEDCSKLQCLPEEGLPASLSNLYIYRCPLLNERCQTEIGEDWPIISHIVHLDIRQ